MEYRHTPVMLTEAIKILQPQPGQTFVDCTLGGGGYSSALAIAVGKQGKVVAIDADRMAITNAKKKFENFPNIFLVHDNFKNLSKIISDQFVDEKNSGFDGIVFDLGLSGAQLEDRNRGLSFQLAAPLEMSFGEETVGKTKNMINHYEESEIFQIIKNYGEERYAHSIARHIIEARKKKLIETTDELLEIIAASVPANYRHDRRLHFATRTFQALRIATNDELINLENVLPEALSLLKNGGRLVLISYHSLEDRIVKTFFKNEARDCICPPEAPVCQCQHRPSLKILTKKPLTPTAEEIKNNPRARSAKLRAAEKIK